MVSGRSGSDGSCQRTVRQVHNEVTEPYVRAELVQLLPDDHHGGHMRAALVSKTTSKHTVYMEMEHSADILVHLHR